MSKRDLQSLFEFSYRKLPNGHLLLDPNSTRRLIQASQAEQYLEAQIESRGVEVIVRVFNPRNDENDAEDTSFHALESNGYRFARLQ